MKGVLRCVARNHTSDEVRRSAAVALVQQAAAHLGRSYWLVYQAYKAGRFRDAQRFGPKLIFIPKKYFDPNRSQVNSQIAQPAQAV
jgi:hypothetical protein